LSPKQLKLENFFKKPNLSKNKIILETKSIRDQTNLYATIRDSKIQLIIEVNGIKKLISLISVETFKALQSLGDRISVFEIRKLIPNINESDAILLTEAMLYRLKKENYQSKLFEL